MDKLVTIVSVDDDMAVVECDESDAVEVAAAIASQMQSAMDAIGDLQMSCVHWKENFFILEEVALSLGLSMSRTPYAPKQRPVAHLSGDADAISSAHDAYATIMTQVKASEKQYLLEWTHGETPAPADARKFGSSFRLGVAATLHQRVTGDPVERVDAFKSRIRLIPAAFHAGQEFAATMDLG